MPTHCFAPLLGKRIRVTTLDNCGRTPQPAAENAWLATKGFVSVSLSAEVEDGTEITQKRADGSLCINEKMNSSFKRLNVEATFCDVNPSLLAMVTNAETYEDYSGDVAGITVGEGDIEKWFALELWTGLSGAACEEGADTAGGYLLLPFVVAGTMGDFEVTGEDAITFALSNSYTKGGNSWGVGPFDVVYDAGDAGTPAPAVLPTPLDALDHLLLMDTGLAPPPSACDPQPMPAAA